MKLFQIFIIALFFCLTGCKGKKTLPYYGQRELKEHKGPTGSMVVDTIYQSIPDFRFLNQDSVFITQSHFNNKIYIADFFFTTCSSICPDMHRNLKEIFEEYKKDPDVYFLSHTIDFKYDKPSVLKNYAKKLGVYGDKWQFAYGSKADVYTLAEKSYLVAVNEDSSAPDGYIHQGYLVLIDKERHIRGAYDGTDKAQVAKLKEDLSTLLKSYK